MKYGGGFDSKGSMDEIERIAAIPIDKWKQDIKSFRELPFEAMAESQIEKEWKKRGFPILYIQFPSASIPETVYRVRPVKQEDTIYTQIQSSFSNPPPEFTKQGRANKESNPVFYCALDKQVAIAESKLGDARDFFLSKWRLTEPPNLYPFLNYKETSIYHGLRKHHQEKMKKFFTENVGTASVHFQELNELFADSFLFNHYNLSSWIAHKTIYEFPQSFDGILYPSEVVNHNGMNIAFHPNFIVRSLKLEKVYLCSCGRKNKDAYNIFLKEYGQIVRNGIHYTKFENLTKEMVDDFWEGLKD